MSKTKETAEERFSKGVCVAFLCALFMFTGIATAAGERVRTVRGWGTQTCAKAIELGEGSVNIIHFSWALGYITAMTPFESNSFTRSFENTKTSSLVAFLTDYCERYPRRLFASATFSLYKELGGDYLIR